MYLGKLCSITCRESWLFFVVGLSSWLLVNGLFLEVPLLVSSLPEGYTLVSFLVIMVQVGNIFGLFYLFLRSVFETNSFQKYIVLIVLVYGTAVCVLLGLFWDKLVVVNQEPKR